MTRADANRAEARRLRAEGLPYAAIGRRLGVSQQMAHQYMSDPPGRDYSGLTRLVDTVAKLAPCTAQQVAAELGIRHITACANLRRADRDGFVRVVGTLPGPGGLGRPSILWDLT